MSEEPTNKAIVAAAQLGPASDTRVETVSRIVDLIHQGAKASAKLLMFPELALSPYFAAEVRPDVLKFAEETFPSDETQPIVDACAATGVSIILPLAEIQGETLYNSSVILDSTGSVVGRYRKSHIPGQIEPKEDGSLTILEKRYFAPGDLGFALQPSPYGSLGVGICYDRRFPELYRCYALQGASLIAVGYNTPVMASTDATIESTQDAQELAVRGGAISNAVPVIAAGKAGVELGTRFSGGSCVVDHTGKIIAKAVTDGDELVVGELDLTAAEAARERMDLATNRRPEIYGAMAGLLETVAG